MRYRNRIILMEELSCFFVVLRPAAHVSNQCKSGIRQVVGCVNIRTSVDIEKEQRNGSRLSGSGSGNCLLIGIGCIRIVK